MFPKIPDLSTILQKRKTAYLYSVIGEFAEGMTTLIALAVSSPRNLAIADAVAFFIIQHLFQLQLSNIAPSPELSFERRLLALFRRETLSGVLNMVSGFYHQALYLSLL